MVSPLSQEKTIEKSRICFYSIDQLLKLKKRKVSTIAFVDKHHIVLIKIWWQMNSNHITTIITLKYLKIHG